MLKKELAQLLGVSESMVSRHSKQGMPTDSVERAQRWRKRHLEPGRVKGIRYDSNAKPAEKAATRSDLGQCVALLDEALKAGPVPHDSPILLNTRHALRTLPDWRAAAESSEMPVRVWVRLIAAVSSFDLVSRARGLDQSLVMTERQLYERAFPEWALPSDPVCAYSAGVLFEPAWDLYDQDRRRFPDGETYPPDDHEDYE